MRQATRAGGRFVHNFTLATALTSAPCPSGRPPGAERTAMADSLPPDALPARPPTVPAADPRRLPAQVSRQLAAWAAKQGVGLGGLSAPDLRVALAVAARALPAGRTWTEAEVNTVLRRVLAEEGRFLDTDHVELRRWLVDTAWWRRDGYGRAYERTPVEHLPPDLRAIAAAIDEALAGQPLASWLDAQRTAAQAARDARRAAWAAKAVTSAAGGTSGDA